MLARVELRQLAQRITGRFHLDPLSKPETAAYINHRLKIAGASGEFFTRPALKEVHRLSGGVPRIINVICDRALLGAFTQESHRIGPALVREAAGEVYGRSFTPPWMKALAGVSAGVAVLGLAIGAWLLMQMNTDEPAVAATAPAPEAVGHVERTTPSQRLRRALQRPGPDIAELLQANAGRRTPKRRSASCSRCGAEGSSRPRDDRAIRRCSKASNACISRAHGASCGRSIDRRSSR